MSFWQTSRRRIRLDRTIVVGILNVTPDSFSDGGNYAETGTAVARAKVMIAEGADIIDVGGESTRPGSERVPAEIEIERVIPVIEAIRARFDVPISVDTSKSEVALAAVAAGAEIVNDISGLRFDHRIADVAAEHKTGLVLMHSRGSFEEMHKGEYAAEVFADVRRTFRESLALAAAAGVVVAESIVLDVGIGFGKSQKQNLELLSGLAAIVKEFAPYPVLVGASRKSFIGRILDLTAVDKRLSGSIAAASIAAWNGASIVRVHDVEATVEALRIVDAIKGSTAATL